MRVSAGPYLELIAQGDNGFAMGVATLMLDMRIVESDRAETIKMIHQVAIIGHRPTDAGDAGGAVDAAAIPVAEQIGADTRSRGELPGDIGLEGCAFVRHPIHVEQRRAGRQIFVIGIAAANADRPWATLA